MHRLLPCVGLLLWVSTAQAGHLEEFLEAVNAVRTEAGLTTLQISPTLDKVAQRYAQLMADSNCVGHSCDPAGDAVARVAATGYHARLVGEALAAGPQTAEEVIRGWLNSPPHRKILLSRDARDVGLGFAYDEAEALLGGFGEYWVLLIADPL